MNRDSIADFGLRIADCGMRTDRLLAINTPRRVKVEVDANGLPTMVTVVQHATCNVQRGVEVVGEVWRIDDEWWRAPIHRRYIEVILDGGQHAVLFEDLTTGEWLMQKP
jgi:hypothetical protein